MKSKILGWSHTERANYWPASHWSPIIGPYRVPARCRPRFRERPKHSKSDVSVFLKLLWAYLCGDVEDALPGITYTVFCSESGTEGGRALRATVWRGKELYSCSATGTLLTHSELIVRRVSHLSSDSHQLPPRTETILDRPSQIERCVSLSLLP